MVMLSVQHNIGVDRNNNEYGNERIKECDYVCLKG